MHGRDSKCAGTDKKCWLSQNVGYAEVGCGEFNCNTPKSSQNDEKALFSAKFFFSKFDKLFYLRGIPEI